MKKFKSLLSQMAKVAMVTSIVLVAGILCLGLSALMIVNVRKAIKEADIKKIVSVSNFQDEYVTMEMQNNISEVISEQKYYSKTCLVIILI